MTGPSSIPTPSSEKKRLPGRIALLSAVVLIVLICLAVFRLPTLTDPKFLKGLPYKNEGWVHDNDGDTQTFIVYAPGTELRKRLDALLAKRVHWFDGGEGSYQWNSDTGETVLVGLDVRNWMAKDEVCRLKLWYERKMNLWDRLKFWLSDEY